MWRGARASPKSDALSEVAGNLELDVGLALKQLLKLVWIVYPLTFSNRLENGAASRTALTNGTDQVGGLNVVLVWRALFFRLDSECPTSTWYM